MAVLNFPPFNFVDKNRRISAKDKANKTSKRTTNHPSKSQKSVNQELEEELNAANKELEMGLNWHSIALEYQASSLSWSIEWEKTNKRIEELEGAIKGHKDSFIAEDVCKDCRDIELWKILNKEGN